MPGLSKSRRICLIALLVLAAHSSAADVDYLRDIKPILKTHCVNCHGPIKSEGDLRLDSYSEITKGGDSGDVLIARKPDDSHIIQRILSADESIRMPMDQAALGDQEKTLLQRWISEGATGPSNPAAEDPTKHWAFQAIRRPDLPIGISKQWNRNPIDSFISAKHKQHGLRVAKPATKPELLRRLYLDLIGIPPTRKQLKAFLDNTSPHAYMDTVNALLDSPMYGERWGRHWLDVWRYSDWYGFQSQVRFSQKNIWHWRDWTIESLNADIGYDSMVVQLLAGDESLPFDPGHLRATGFLVRNRNTDSREQWIRDTIEHTSKALFGITMACAQCHDHPYDPITQEEYYKYRNIFEPVSVNIDNAGGGPNGNDIAGVARIFDQNRNAKTTFYIRGNDKTPDEDREIIPGVPVSLGEWSEPEEVTLPALARIPLLREPVARQVLARYESEIDTLQIKLAHATEIKNLLAIRLSNPDFRLFEDSTNLLSTTKVLTGDAMMQGDWSLTDGVASHDSANADNESWLDIPVIVSAPAYLSLQVDVAETTENAYVGVIVDTKDDLQHIEGCHIQLNGDQSGLHVFNGYEGSRNPLANLHRSFEVGDTTPLKLELVIEDKLINIYLNNTLLQTYQSGSIENIQSVRLITRGAVVQIPHLELRDCSESPAIVPPDEFAKVVPKISINDMPPLYEEFGDILLSQSKLNLAIKQLELVAHKAADKADRYRYLAVPDSNDEAAVTAHREAHEELAKTVQGHQRKLALLKAELALQKARVDLRVKQLPSASTAEQQSEIEKAIDSSKTALENALKNKTNAEQKLTEPATPQYQGLIGSYGSSSGRRLSLANWLVSDSHPLTARIAINHIWLRHFNQPIVDSVFDFGLNGSTPTHPALLDFLASELKSPTYDFDPTSQRWDKTNESASSWSLKHIHRLIVTSSTYQLAYLSNKKNDAIDNDNRWLWHRPTHRMDAEVVRDSVLFLAGELDTTIGGPSFPSEHGMHVKRRSMYFHQSPEEQMDFLKVFDGVDPAECYRRHTSVVPHQSLALFNSELVIVQSRILAHQLNTEFSADDDFIIALFQHMLSRPPTKQEHRVCKDFLIERTTDYQQNLDPNEDTDPNSTVSADSPADESYESPSQQPSLRARENLTKSLFNHHEFVTIP